MGKILNILFAVGLVGSALAGCNNTGCVDNQSSIPLAGFYSYETLGTISLSNISVGGVDAPDDSLLLDHESVAEVYLPFRSLLDETAFFIRYEDTGEPDPEDPEDPGDSGEENPGGNDSEGAGDGETGTEPSAVATHRAVSRAVPAIADTLKFKYERIPYFVSEDCGAMYRYKVLEFETTHYMIDSIALLDSVITNVNRRTIQIYFRTQQPDNPQPES